MAQIRFVMFLLIFPLLLGCSKETEVNDIDPQAPEERMLGVIKISEKDYTPDVSMLMLQDDESEKVRFDTSKRSFQVNAPFASLYKPNSRTVHLFLLSPKYSE